MRKLSVILIVFSFLIAGCSNEKEDNIQDERMKEVSQSESEIKIVLADAHKNQIKNEGIQKELEDVQRFFDENSFQYNDGTVNFVVLRGLYNHDEEAMTVVGVFVNKTGESINGLTGTLAFDFIEEESTEFSELEFNFDSKFLGELQNNQGFLIHINVPVDGLEGEKDVYQATEITGEVKDVEVIYLNK